MNLNFRKTALLAGICSVFSLGYAPQLFAVSSTDTVEAVQQTKKITGVVSDAMGPIIGANVLEKGTEEFYKLKYCSTVVYMVPRA